MLQIGTGLEINSAWDFCFIRSSTILLQTEVGIPLSPSLYVPLGAFNSPSSDLRTILTRVKPSPEKVGKYLFDRALDLWTLFRVTPSVEVLNLRHLQLPSCCQRYTSACLYVDKERPVPVVSVTSRLGLVLTKISFVGVASLKNRFLTLKNLGVCIFYFLCVRQGRQTSKLMI